MVEILIVSFIAITITGWWCTSQIVGFKISTLISILWIICNMIIVNCISNEPTPQELHIYNQGRKGVGYR
jgi:hypothetical protein